MIGVYYSVLLAGGAFLASMLATLKRVVREDSSKRVRVKAKEILQGRTDPKWLLNYGTT